MTDIHTIWLLLGIGYFLGLVIIAYFGIVGPNEFIDFTHSHYTQGQIKQIGSSHAFETAIHK